MAFTLELLPGFFAICRLDLNAAIPEWATGDFVSLTRSPEELSVVCTEESVPSSARCEAGWRCLRVAGKLDFSMVGVLAGLTTVLAVAGVSVFVVSTFDTDYVLVKNSALEESIRVLEEAGYSVSGGQP